MLISFLISQPINACTTFHSFACPEPVVANNLDWSYGDGTLNINPRGVKKSAILKNCPLGKLNCNPKPVEPWISKFGSVTITQSGSEFPFGGMNEKGLTVNIMLESGQVPPNQTGANGSINEIQWIQYILDSAPDVKTAIELANKMSVSRINIPAHYMVCDRQKKCAVFDYINGKLVTKEVDSVDRPPVLANKPYDEELKALNSGDRRSDRFCDAVDAVTKDRSLCTSPMESAFKILDKVKFKGDMGAKWSMVLDPNKLLFHYRSAEQRTIKTIELGKIDFSCALKTHRQLDLNAPNMPKEDLWKKFHKFDDSRNKALINGNADHIVPPALKEALIAYPNSTTCTQELETTNGIPDSSGAE